MEDDFEQQEWVKFGVSAALSRQYSADERTFLELLAQMLERALPGEVEIKKHGALFGKKTIQSVSIVLGNIRYTLEDPGRGSLVALKTKIVRGIALKTEEMTVKDILEEMGAGLEERMHTSSTARDALSQFVDPM